MPKVSIIWVLFGYPTIFIFSFFLGACFNRKDGHVKVGNKWITVEDYLKLYGGKK